MFKPKLFAISSALAASMLLSVILAGCGSDSTLYSTAPQMPSSSSSSAAAAEDGNYGASFGKRGLNASGELAQENADTKSLVRTEDTAATAPAVEQRKLVKNAFLSLETKEFDNALAALNRLVEETGGYLDSQSINGQSLRYERDYYERSATITARVPADKLDLVTGQLGSICNVLSKSEDISDISDRYYDSQSRLDTLKIKEARLQELLAKAEKLEDIIQLESALSDCQYEMDSLTGQLRRMDNQVSYSTLNIELAEVVEYQAITEKPRTFWERISDSTLYSGRRLLRTLENALFFVIEQGPVLLVYLAFWGGIVWLVIHQVTKKRAQIRREFLQQMATPPTPPAEPIPQEPQD